MSKISKYNGKSQNTVLGDRCNHLLNGLYNLPPGRPQYLPIPSQPPWEAYMQAAILQALKHNKLTISFMVRNAKYPFCGEEIVVKYISQRYKRLKPPYWVQVN